MTEIPAVKFKRLSPHAILPQRAHKDDACFDIFATQDAQFGVSPVAVGIGWAVAIPKGWCMRILPRSGMGLKFGPHIGNSPGTIDSGYRGEIKVILYSGYVNYSGYRTIRRGDKIAQIELRPVHDWSIEEVEELDETDRGTRGLGSTGQR